MKNNKIKMITFTALFTALVAVATMVIQIPVGEGYVHVGDSMIYLAACILPAPCAVFAASVGAGIADALTGFVIYVPATVIIKALNALPFILMRVYLKKKNGDGKILNPHIAFMLIPTTLVTMFGYLIADYLLFGEKFAVISAFTGGWVQPLGSALIFLALAAALDKAQFKKKVIL